MIRLSLVMSSLQNTCSLVRIQIFRYFSFHRSEWWRIWRWRGWLIRLWRRSCKLLTHRKNRWRRVLWEIEVGIDAPQTTLESQELWIYYNQFHKGHKMIWLCCYNPLEDWQTHSWSGRGRTGLPSIPGVTSAWEELSQSSFWMKTYWMMIIFLGDLVIFSLQQCIQAVEA